MVAADRVDPLDGLVDGVRRGDRDAIAAVYLETAPALRGYLRRRVPHGEVADDLVEQAFVALIEHGSDLRGDGRSLRAWLFRVARNGLYDWAKRADRRGDGELTPERSAQLRDPDADPGESVPAASIDPRLVVALGQLTAEQREVVELRLVADLSLTQVADITGRTVGAVKLLQHRAVRRLAAALSAAVAPDP
jgi:RNA polymerase sigma-70 factor, ECF subfamily